MDPRRPPLWAWAALTVAGALLRYDFRVGDASLANAVALLAGCLLPPGRAARTQALALPALVLLSLPGPVGAPADWGYAIGRIGVAWMVARLVGPGARPPRGAVAGPLLLIAGCALAAALRWHPDTPGLDLRAYYGAVVALAGLIAIYYALRLVQRPARIAALIAGLLPYYLLGILWALAWGAAAGGEATGATAPLDVVFHGLVTHLPGDGLICVVVAFFTGPRRGLLEGKAR